MRSFLIGVVATLLLVAGMGEARAEEGPGVQVGVKMWYNDWSQDRPGFGSITSDYTTLLGPAIEAKFENQVFIEASYLISTADYHFSDQISAADVERQDLDVAVGYLIIPEFGVLLGYKNTTFKERTTGIEDTLYGPGLGVNTNLPLNEDLSFYGRLDFLFTRFEQNDAGVVFREDSPGWMFEFGLKYAFTRSFFGSLGYKYETNEGNDTNVRDTFSGVTLGAMVGF